MNWLQDLFIRLLSPWIPIVRKIQPKVRYRVLTACFMADLVLFCIVRYVLMKESYFYNTVCGIFLMLVIAIFSLDKKLERRKWHRGLSVCIDWNVYHVYDLRLFRQQESLRTWDHTGPCTAGSVFCVAE